PAFALPAPLPVALALPASGGGLVEPLPPSGGLLPLPSLPVVPVPPVEPEPVDVVPLPVFAPLPVVAPLPVLPLPVALVPEPVVWDGRDTVSASLTLATSLPSASV